MSEQHESPLNSGRFYGWQPSPPDIRDMMYMPSPTMRGALPPSVLLNVPELPAPFSPAWQQGGIGSCGPHSAALDLVFAQLKQDANAGSAVMPSRLFIYYNTRQLMGTVNQDSGVQNRALLKSLAQFGWCDESLWPYSDSRQKMTTKPPAECYEQAATRRISAYLAVQQDLTTMKTCLADGDPFIFGFSVYESLESPMVTRTGMIPMPNHRERQVGGHDVLVIGYRDDIGCFVIRNSWGAEWGENGTGYIPYAYATHPQLAGDFWTVRKSARPDVSPPTPAPRPAGKEVRFGPFDIEVLGQPLEASVVFSEKAKP